MRPARPNKVRDATLNQRLPPGRSVAPTAMIVRINSLQNIMAGVPPTQDTIKEHPCSQHVQMPGHMAMPVVEAP
eukprot:792713-Amphidinium_carterae.1